MKYLHTLLNAILGFCVCYALQESIKALDQTGYWWQTLHFPICGFLILALSSRISDLEKSKK
jgi:hypothetical protein